MQKHCSHTISRQLDLSSGRGNASKGSKRLEGLRGTMSTWLKVLGAVTVLWSSAFAIAGQDAAEALLRQHQPGLYRLYRQYPTYHEQFARYADQEGFTAPVEKLATIVHELIHVDSFVHQGYYIDGVYYEPYVRPGAWPKVSNADIGNRASSSYQGPIYYLYVRKTPKNNLGNVVDEINAYTHVTPFVCRFEPESAIKQVNNLVGFLNVVEMYLSAMKNGFAMEYVRLGNDQAARGMLLLAIQRARGALAACGMAPPIMPEFAEFERLTARR